MTAIVLNSKHHPQLTWPQFTCKSPGADPSSPIRLTRAYPGERENLLDVAAIGAISQLPPAEEDHHYQLSGPPAASPVAWQPREACTLLLMPLVLRFKFFFTELRVQS